jgi:hypothetical protein
VIFDMLLRLKHKIKHAFEESVASNLSWTEYLAGGFEILDESKIIQIMDKTYNNHWYSKLRNKTKILGIWDDNDFGVNDGMSDNPIKH